MKNNKLTTVFLVLILCHYSQQEQSEADTIIFRDEFDHFDSNKWQAQQTSSYAYGTHNPDHNKLDWISPNHLWYGNGHVYFTANPSDKTLENGMKAWDTGLLSTEYRPEAFKVYPNNYIETNVYFDAEPGEVGTWPALWTWKDGKNEVDTFEFHAENPNVLEFTNHVNPKYCLYKNSTTIGPKRWIRIGTHYGRISVSWFVNDEKIFSDNRGVGVSWSAYLILNLSISQRPPPKNGNTKRFVVDYVRVYKGLPSHLTRYDTDYCRTNGHQWG